MGHPGFFKTLNITYAGTLVDPGRSIRRSRTNSMMTQAELAKKAGITQSYLSQLELNKVAASQKTYDKIAKAMYMSLDQMFGI